MVRFQVYKDRSGEHRWRLIDAGNHRIIADSAEGYVVYAGAVRAVENVVEDIITSFQGIDVDQLRSMLRSQAETLGFNDDQS
jgi:uncharacterized protein YegP (UPF0339 family)